MPDIKEKLIALFESYKCEFENCDKCPHLNVPGACSNSVLCGIADYLIANGVTIPEWIPVTERLPDNKKCVLMYSPDGGVAEGCYEESRKRWVQWRWSVFDVPNVTHWMPLPEPPKEVTP